MPRFQGENLDANLQLIAQLERVAQELVIKPGQLALAWLLAQGDDIVPIPGTKHVQYLEENVAAADIQLDSAVVARLTEIFEPSRVRGERYGMSWQESADAGDY